MSESTLTDQKPTAWEPRGRGFWRRVAVRPNVLCSVVPDRDTDTWWAVAEMGLPGVTVAYEETEHPTAEAAQEAALAAALAMVDGVITRMQEARTVLTEKGGGV